VANKIVDGTQMTICFHVDDRKLSNRSSRANNNIIDWLSLKSSLKQWGDKAFAAVTSEMKQLHFCNTFKPKHWSELSKTQRQTVLESHMFLKEKRDDSLKGRTVAGGNKQRDYISMEDASSPTVATEAVLLSCIINAEEGRDVTVIDIPNAFIQMSGRRRGYGNH
jgi:hypothetical protein